MNSLMRKRLRDMVVYADTRIGLKLSSVDAKSPQRYYGVSQGPGPRDGVFIGWSQEYRSWYSMRHTIETSVLDKMNLKQLFDRLSRAR